MNANQGMDDNSVVSPVTDLDGDRTVTATDQQGAPVLIAARCRACATLWFPMRSVCPNCAAGDPQEQQVGPSGTLYSYSRVHLSSSRQTPYTLGYVDLDEGVRILATIEPPDRLRLDARCHLEVAPDGRWFFTVEEAAT